MEDQELGIQLHLLKEAAKKAIEHVYAPYSNFRVGAVAQGVSGKYYTGCNIENASYGATCCAERVAIFKGVSEGERRFKQLVLWTPDAEGYASPCGICRQVISEFFEPDARVIMLDESRDSAKVMTVEELLPHAFYLEPDEN